MDLNGGVDAIVVGSGFGGAVAGARLAQAGLRVAILERGRRWPRGSFPRDDTDLKTGWLWQSGRGLFDIRWLDRMLSVQGAGWGDGAAVPSATGVNPSASILAMAERNVERAIRRILDDRLWEAPEMSDVTAADVPEDQAMLLMSAQRRERSGNGVRFREAMTGWLQTTGATRATRLTLEAHIAGWAPFLGDPSHPILISGALDIEGLATARPVAGTLELFPDAGDVAMRYRLQSSDDDGDALLLIGTKRQHRRNPLRLWSDLTTLDIEAADTVGRLRMSPLGTLKLASSIRGDAFTPGKRAAAVARFLTYFIRSALSGMLRS